MLIYQMLSVMVEAGRLASCIALIERQNRLLDRMRSTGKEAQTYRLINQLLFNRVLQKLGTLVHTQDSSTAAGSCLPCASLSRRRKNNLINWLAFHLLSISNYSLRKSSTMLLIIHKLRRPWRMLQDSWRLWASRRNQ